MTDTVALGDIVDIKGGGTPSRSNAEYWGGSIPWATVKDFKSTDLAKTQESITEDGVLSSATNIIPAGAVVIPTRMALGKAAINSIDMAINQDLKALLPKSGYHNRFLLHFLLSKASYLEGKGKGATVKGITLDILRSLKIPFVPEKEQRRIAAILDKAEGIRQNRQKAISLIDILVRNAFLELFGDPVSNLHGFDSRKVEALLSNTRGAQSGPFGSSLKKHEYVNRGIPVWGVENVQENAFIPSAKLFVTEQKFQDLKRYSVEKGDVLISRAGTVGRMCVARPGTDKSIISTNLVRVALDKEQITSEYFVSLFTYLPHRLGGLRANQKDGAFTFLNPKTLKSLKIPVPPLKLQERYVDLVRQSELLLKRSKAQLTLADYTCRALSQRAFRNEL
jgi:type I restriction enzyme, S subunit